jgi:nicotinamidase-related amidase
MPPSLHAQWKTLDFEQLVKEAAFINMDSQNSILHPEGVLSHEGIWRGAREHGGSLHNTLRLATECQRAKMPFVWFRYDRFVGEKEPGNAMDRAQYHHWNKDYVGDNARKMWEADLVDEVKNIMQPEDLTYVYPAWSIFVGTPLLRWLGQWGSRTLIFSGYHTDWCVEMATRSARDLGFMPVVIGDACGTTHPLHEQTLQQINDCYAPVISTDFAIEVLNQTTK